MAAAEQLRRWDLGRGGGGNEYGCVEVSPSMIDKFQDHVVMLFNTADRHLEFGRCVNILPAKFPTGLKCLRILVSLAVLVYVNYLKILLSLNSRVL